MPPPVWSADSAMVAAIEQSETTALVCVASLHKSVQVIRSPFQAFDGPITWIAGRPVVKVSGSAYAVDMAKAQFVLAPASITEALDQLSASQRRMEEAKQKATDLAKRNGGRGAVVRPGGSSRGKIGVNSAFSPANQYFRPTLRLSASASKPQSQHFHIYFLPPFSNAPHHLQRYPVFRVT